MNQVIDTNVWVNAFSYGEDKDKEQVDRACAMAVMIFMSSGDSLVFDHEGLIQAEYNDGLKFKPEFERCMLLLDQSKRMYHCSSHCPARHDRKLYELKFHEPDDHVFVGAAMNSDRSIITEDSDYGVHGEPEHAKVYEYMKNIMGIDAMTAGEYVGRHEVGRK